MNKNPEKGVPEAPQKEAAGLTRAFLQREDEPVSAGLRPQKLEQYVGQEKLKENLKVFIGAARNRKEPLEHILFSGPPGLGKTTLASVIAHELGVSLKISSGPAMERQGDLAAILTNLEDHDVFFIDEIHRLNRVVEEALYPAMEEYKLDVIIGKGPSARSLRIDLPRFTLIGATTRIGQISSPLRDRFGFLARLDFYNTADLTEIVSRSARILKIDIEPDAAKLIGSCSRGTPRVANRLLKRVRDYAEIKGDGGVDQKTCQQAMAELEIDSLGLEPLDRKILTTIITKFDGGPVGVETLAASLNEEVVTLEDVYEPYLMQLGFMERTPRGRVATRLAYRHLGRKYGDGAQRLAQPLLFTAGTGKEKEAENVL
jgi:holliday junction DNA helicase RuvB